MADLCTLSPVTPQLSLFPEERRGGSYSICLTPEVNAMLEAGCVVAVGVSGGKDSVACALAVDRHLKQIGHTGPKVMIHSDLGLVEWKASLPGCERLARHLGWDLIVTRRKAGGLMERWETRWANNIARYRNLECVRVIPPWSSSIWRFCTSELKSAVIASELRRRYPTEAILSVTGIRHQESTFRSHMPTYAPDPRLLRKGAFGATWNAVITWPIEDVYAYIQENGLALHEAYTVYGSSRVSCVFCVMASKGDILASTRCADNAIAFRRMVDLEALSTFSFQQQNWLADFAPHLLSAEQLDRVALAKVKAGERQQAESLLPEHLLYKKGWPTCVPTFEEASLIAEVRTRVSLILGVEVQYLTADSIRGRYEELIAAREAKLKAESKGKARGKRSANN